MRSFPCSSSGRRMCFLKCSRLRMPTCSWISARVLGFEQNFNISLLRRSSALRFLPSCAVADVFFCFFTCAVSCAVVFSPGKRIFGRAIPGFISSGPRELSNTFRSIRRVVFYLFYHTLIVSDAGRIAGEIHMQFKAGDLLIGKPVKVSGNIG